MYKVVILGAGRIGRSICHFLHDCEDYDIVLVDANADAFASILTDARLAVRCLDVNQQAKLIELLRGREVVISACPYSDNKIIAEAALAAGVSYFDLTEDVEVSDHIYLLSKRARQGQKFLPQCGLAPGFVSILANSVISQFDSVDTVKMRVGALPVFPNNQIMYNLTWSTEGLINEYCNPCRAIKQGRIVELQALEGLESFSLDGLEYEAFNTSGGLGTLCQSLEGRVEDLTYKTIRYKGHQYLMSFLINGLQLGKNQRLLKDIVEGSIAITKQDVVIVMISVVGIKDGLLTQVTDMRKVYHQWIGSRHWSAIEVTTAASICTIVDMFFHDELPEKPFIRQEEISLPPFLENRFGHYYLAACD